MIPSREFGNVKCTDCTLGTATHIVRNLTRSIHLYPFFQRLTLTDSHTFIYLQIEAIFFCSSNKTNVQNSHLQKFSVVHTIEIDMPNRWMKNTGLDVSFIGENTKNNAISTPINCYYSSMVCIWETERAKTLFWWMKCDGDDNHWMDDTELLTKWPIFRTIFARFSDKSAWRNGPENCGRFEKRIFFRFGCWCTRIIKILNFQHQTKCADTTTIMFILWHIHIHKYIRIIIDNIHIYACILDTPI